MEGVPDMTLTNSPNINSVLKPPKPRVPLKDLITAAPEEDNTAARKRRVSFANVNKIKEFSAGAESMVVCQTPAYEEPFSVSSDSSYPSGVDGWTPAKVQPGKPPVHPEKENITVQSLRMSSGMDLTSLVGNFDYNTRYSVNGMDLTEVANVHSTHIDQQTRFSLGMDLTNVAGYSYQNTRYSVSGMDLTNMAHSDQITRLSMGMDLTNVVSHPTQNTRYSVNAMDLTEAINPHQTFLDQRSARFSVGMDMTDVIGNTVSTMRYSCSEMDFTEVANQHCYREQYCEGDTSANVSINDSDALELTEVVDGAQFSAPSPKYKTSNVGLAENVLYSVNNTRYSVNSMDLTSGPGPRLSTVRRKSSRYSLVNMDLTEAINNSSFNLEMTEAIADPQMKAGSTRNSLCEMDMTAGAVDKGVTRLTPDSMDQTSVVGEELEYSADTESIVNMSKSVSNSCVDNKENILPNQSFKLASVPATLSHEDIVSTAPNELLSVSGVIPQHIPTNENEQNSLLNILPKCGSEQEKCDALKDSNSEVLNLPLIHKEVMEENILNDKGTSCVISETLSKSAVSVSYSSNEIDNNRKSVPSDSTLHNILQQNNIDEAFNKSSIVNRSNFVEELKQTMNGTCVVDLEHDSSRKEYAIEQHTIHVDIKEESNSLPRNEENINKQNISKGDISMDVSITEDTGLGKHASNIDVDSHKHDIDTDTHSNELPNTEQPCPKEMCSLNESVMNMSIDNCSLVNEVEVLENVEEQVKGNSEKNISVHVSNKEANSLNTSHHLEEQNYQLTIGNVTEKDQSIELHVSSNTSLNLTSSTLYNKNITMTRGRSKSFIITPDTSMDISQKDSRITEDKTPSIQITPVTLDIPTNDGGLNHSESILKNEVSFGESELRYEKRGKRSFEEALEPENDIEESPNKQLCSREETSTEYQILNNVTAPSFLMETMANEKETLPSSDKCETTAVDHQLESESTSNFQTGLSYTTANNGASETKNEFSLRMDNSPIRNMSEVPLRDEVIDLCESSFDATSTEVRALINSSCYKTRIIPSNDEILINQNFSFNSSLKKTDCTSSLNLSFENIQIEDIPQPSLKQESTIDDSLEVAIETKVKKEEEENTFTNLVPPHNSLKSTSRRKRDKVRSIGNNSYIADFIPNFVQIHFSINSRDNVIDVSYHRICSGDDRDIGEYLLKQAMKRVLPEKGSDLIHQLKTANKCSLASLARTVNMICKYMNGSIKGDILTLEVASCKKHFWAMVDVDIKHPKYLSETDIKISSQKIGTLKLADVRQIFNNIKKDENLLLNFAKAVMRLQYNN